MGNRQTVEQVSGRPRTFYLVSGTPSIRFTGHPPSNGPLIFNVEADYLVDAESVDRAEMIQMPLAVPSRQSFKLTQFDPKNRRAGYLLSFSIAMLKPGRTLRVLAGVNIEYQSGVGVRLTQSIRSQNPFCVFEFASPEEFVEDIEAGEKLHVGKLMKASFRKDINGMRRLMYAPIAIEILYEMPLDEVPMSIRCSSATRGSADGTSHTSSNACGGGGATSPSSSVESVVQMAQYTFLDIPEVLLRRTPATLPPQRAREEEDGRPVFEAKVVRQFLQCGPEVYELDDVFDIGADDDAAINDSSNEEDEEFNDKDSCVICLQNRRDTTLLPCRHMCLCYECVSVLRLQQNNRCPVCRSNIDRVLTV